MPKKAASEQEGTEKEKNNVVPIKEEKEDQIKSLNRMLGAVLEYLSDDQIEEIDIEYLLQNTKGLQEWWDKYREQNRKKIEEEVKKSLEGLSLDELEKIREQIKQKKSD
ncbi:hypothetical protein GCM10008967_30270 [Bacillus carboniphilus]|uniref:Uncharacterized protein n=1 Tax=Bacillus carboniphilus TaxID=86663 RepID=A0ABN0WIM7_9BACI